MSETTDIVANLKGWLKDWDGIDADCVGLLRQLRIEQIEVLKRAVTEIETLRAEVADCHRVMSEDVHIKKLNYENGRLDIRGTHPLLSSLIAEVVSMFASAGAENYFEMEGYHPDTGPLTFTIQRREGKSPGRIAQELRDELRLLKAIDPYEETSSEG